MRYRKEREHVKLGIMQPYFLPYIGYWQLLNAVDTYVIYDDVNFIKGGWINRNRILIDGRPAYLNVPLLRASCNKRINEIAVDHSGLMLKKHLKTVEMAYKKAPYFSEVFPLVTAVMGSEKKSLSGFLEDSIRIVCSYLSIDTTLIVSSSLKKNSTLKGQDKILDLCSRLEADQYYNAIGGQKLYSYDVFREHGIELKFLQTDPIEYAQFQNEFQPNLSILDVMMFNSAAKIQEMMTKYTLIGKESEHDSGKEQPALWEEPR